MNRMMKRMPLKYVLSAIVGLAVIASSAAVFAATFVPNMKDATCVDGNNCTYTDPATGITYVASASSTRSLPPNRAFDGGKTNKYEAWRAYGSVGWLMIDLGAGNARTANTYAVTGSTYRTDVSPKDWTFEGSDDAASWTILDTQVSQTGWALGETRGFAFTNSAAYRYYRLNVSANNGNSYLMVQELEIDEGEVYSPPPVSSDPPPAIEYRSSLSVSYPGRMAQDSEGNIYVADARENKISVFDRYGGKVRDITSVARPAAVAADPATGSVYAASDQGVFLLDDNDQPAVIVANGDVGSPSDMAVDSVGYIYVVDRDAGVVKVFTPAGGHVVDFAGSAGWYPVSVTIGQGVGADDETGAELIHVGYSVENSDSLNNEMVMAYDVANLDLVRAFGVPFAAVVDSGGDAPSPDPAYITRVDGIALDGEARVYIADSYAGRVTIFDRVGAHMTVLRVGEIPKGIMCDMYGRLIVSTLSGMVKIYTIDGSDVPNAVPTAPTFVSPVGGIRADANPTLVAGNSIDSNGDQLAYEFQVSTNVGMSDVVWSSGLTAEGADGKTSVLVDIALGEDTDYYWRVRSFDGAAYSPWSQTTAFFVNAENSPPVIDSASPADASQGVDVGASIAFSVTGSDPDRDRLTVTWLVDGSVVSRGSTYDYAGTVDSIGDHTVRVDISDREFTVGREWTVTVYRPNTAPTAPSANTPVGGSDVASLRPALSVNNSSDAEGDALTYTFEVSTVSDFTNIVASVSGVAQGANTTSAALEVDLVENTLYYWRAMSCEVSKDGDYVRERYCSPVSAAESFFVNTVNDISTTPGISFPADGTEVDTRTPVLEITGSTDVDINDKLTYEFEVAIESGFRAPVAAVSGVAGAEDGAVSWSVGMELHDNLTYYWRARAFDGADYSGWATAWFFVNTENDSPTAPTADSPSSGQEVGGAAQTLVVNNSTDVDGDTLGYIFEIDTVNTFDSRDKKTSSLIAEGYGTTSWTVEGLSDNTMYYWRAKANDGAADSPWMAAASFFINTANEAPAAPVIGSPAGGLKVNSGTPALEIYAATDADGDALGYIYQVSGDPSFSSIVAESAPEGLSWTVAVALEENTAYYWRVKAVDEHGLEGGWSDAGSFMVDIANDPPTAPVIGWQSFVDGAPVELEIGNSTDVDGYSRTYSVEVYSDRGLTQLVYAEEGVVEGADTTICQAGALEDGIYFWRVRAKDEDDAYGSWSSTRVFRVDGPDKGNGSGGGANGGRADRAYGRKKF